MGTFDGQDVRVPQGTGRRSIRSYVGVCVHGGPVAGVCVCMWITGETTSENHHADALSQYIDI